MGIYDELCAELWPNPATRPFFILGTTTHGVTATERRGEVIHMSKVGEGDIKWGLVPDPRKEVDLEKWIYGKRVSDTSVLSPPESPSLPLPRSPLSDTSLDNLRETLSALLSLTELNSTLLPMPHLHHTLLLKVALNATINPLTAIIGAGSLPNGSLIGSSPSHRLIRMLSAETSSIITAYLNSLHAPHPPPADIVRLYTREALVSRTLALCHATSGNTSSMAADTSAGRLTEIDNINGYLLQLAERVGVPAPHHQMLREMVKFTTEITGLRKETSLGTRTRITRRKIELSDKITDTNTRQLLLGEERFQRQVRNELRETRRERRLGRQAKRRELASDRWADSAANQDVDEGVDEIKSRKENDRARRALSKPTKRAEAEVDPRKKDDMLAHLDTLVRSVRDPDFAGEQASQAPVSHTKEDESGKQDESTSTEEDEAIKALEERILGGTRGFGSRRY
jgi:2-dehydropantoate 2-reductase